MYTKGTNVSELLGVEYDWRSGIPGNPEIARHHYIKHSMSGAMPLNMSHPRVNGKFIEGGPWVMWKEEVSRWSDIVTVYRYGERRAYHGGFTNTTWNTGSSGRPVNWNDMATLRYKYDTLTGLGARAWNRMRPDQPNFDLATQLGELKDLPRTLKQAVNGVRELTQDAIARKFSNRASRRGRPSISKTGEWHLAITFGWLPVLSSARDFIRAQREGQKALAKLLKNEEKWKRRSTKFPVRKDGETVTVVCSPLSTHQSPVFVTQCYANSGGGGLTRTDNLTTVETWAKGDFKYFLPPGPRNVAWNRKMLRRLMGSRITPNTFYQLMPWSWLADYFTDLGQFVQAISPGVADRLVARNCYLMETTTYKTEVSTSNVYFSNGLYSPNHKVVRAWCGFERLSTTKMRTEASPFGFGFSPNDLTATQVGILGALGFSKLPSSITF